MGVSIVLVSAEWPPLSAAVSPVMTYWSSRVPRQYILSSSRRCYSSSNACLQIGEVGAGLQVPPNMMRILTRWGLRDTVITSSVSLTSVHIRRWASGALLGDAPVNKSFGDQYVIHRADLHRALYERATGLPNVRVRVNATAVSADFGEEGKEVGVMLEGGERVEADVVLAADGIRSRLRQQMLGLKVNTPTPTPTGDAAYRVILPRSAMLTDPDLRELIDTARGTRWIGPGRHIMAYPIKAHQQYNMVLLRPDTSGGSEESWTAVGTKQELVDTYKGWDPVLQKTFNLISDEKVMRWKLCTHGFLETWTKGRVALLGDACHPMLYASLFHLSRLLLTQRQAIRGPRSRASSRRRRYTRRPLVFHLEHR